MGEKASSSPNISIIFSITVKKAPGLFLLLPGKGSEIVCLNSIKKLTRQYKEKFQQGYKYLKIPALVVEEDVNNRKSVAGEGRGEGGEVCPKLKTTAQAAVCNDRH